MVASAQVGQPARVEQPAQIGLPNQAGTPAVSRRARRWTLPGGRWPWWAWLLYALSVGPLILLALVPLAVLCLALPAPDRLVWGFRRRRSALVYLLLVALLGLGVALLAGRPAEDQGGTSGPGRAAQAVSGAAAGQTARPAASTGALSGAAAAVVSAAAPTLVPTTAPTVVPAVAPTVAPTFMPSPAPAVVPTAVAQPTTAPTAVPRTPTAAAGGRVAVANTGGAGVALRRSPRWADRTGQAWRDGTVLAVLQDGITGDNGSGGTALWLRVRGPDGAEGYVPAQYTAPAL